MHTVNSQLIVRQQLSTSTLTIETNIQCQQIILVFLEQQSYACKHLKCEHENLNTSEIFQKVNLDRFVWQITYKLMAGFFPGRFSFHFIR